MLRKILPSLLGIVLITACIAPIPEGGEALSTGTADNSPQMEAAPAAVLTGTAWTLAELQINDEAVDVDAIAPVELRFDEPRHAHADSLMVIEHQRTSTLREVAASSIRLVTADTFVYTEDDPWSEVADNDHTEIVNLVYAMSQASQFEVDPTALVLTLTGEGMSARWEQTGAFPEEASLAMTPAAARLYDTLWTLQAAKAGDEAVDFSAIAPVELRFADPLSAEADLSMLYEYQFCGPTLRRVVLSDVLLADDSVFERLEYPVEDIGCALFETGNEPAINIPLGNRLSLSEDGNVLILADGDRQSEWRRVGPASTP